MIIEPMTFLPLMKKVGVEFSPGISAPWVRTASIPKFVLNYLGETAILSCMNAKALELLKQVETWPEADQEELIAAAREIEARRTGTYRLSDDERAAIRKGMDAARRGDFASDDEVEAFYQHHRKA